VESTWPKLDRKVCAQQEGSNGVVNHKVAAFHWSILIGGISTGRSDVVSKSSEVLAHFRIVVELTALVHENTFTRASRSVFFQEISEPVARRGF